jgi:holo-[acyl-carrier protein] synthase
VSRPAPVGAVVGVGVDLVDVARLRVALDRRPGLADRLFTPSERTAAAGEPDPVAHLARGLAAKESVMKSLGCGFDAVSFTDIDLTVGSDAVTVVLAGRAREHEERLGVRHWHVSVSGTDRLAQAVAVATA